MPQIKRWPPSYPEILSLSAVGEASGNVESKDPYRARTVTPIERILPDAPPRR